MNDSLPVTTIVQLPSDFSADIFGEHLEEAAFLYDQRGTLFHDPEVSWLEIGEFEERLEAHIDALTVGGDAALYVCYQQAADGEAGELHAAVRVFCRQKRIDLIQQVLDALDIDDKERILAVRNALKLEWPNEWHRELERMLRETPDKSIAVLPAVAGYKRIPAEGALLYVLPICPESVLYPEIKSMGRLKAQSARAELQQHLEHNDHAVCSAAALSLLRMGVNPIDSIPSVPESPTFCQIMTIALAGGPGYVPLLLGKLENAKYVVDYAFALGVLGDSQSVAPLIRCLFQQENPGTVAIALNLLTGADLYEDVFIQDEIDENELFDDEIGKLKKGETLYSPGDEPGTTVTQLTQDPRKWELWWRNNQSRFKPGTRYRNGKPYSPSCLLDNLHAERSPVLVRQIAYEELVVRYGIDVSFETDMTVRDQLLALSRMETAIQAAAGRYKDGSWYFAGRENK